MRCPCLCLLGVWHRGYVSQGIMLLLRAVLNILVRKSKRAYVF